MPVDPADFISADAPGTKPKPTLPPARNDSLRKFLLLVDIRFVSPVRITRVDYDIGSRYAQDRLLGKKNLKASGTGGSVIKRATAQRRSDMNPYDELVAALFRRVAACQNPKTTRFPGRWPGAGSPAEHLDWGARLLHDAPLAHCRPLAGLNKNTFFFRGRALRPPHAGCPRGDPGSRLPPATIGHGGAVKFTSS